MKNFIIGAAYLSFIIVIIISGAAAVGIFVNLLMLYVVANIIGIAAIFLFTSASSIFSDIYDEIVIGHGQIAKPAECIFVGAVLIIAVLTEWWFLGLGLLIAWCALVSKRAFILSRGRR